MIKIVTLLLLFSFQISFSQTTFQRTFGGANDDSNKEVQQTADGGYIAVGTTKSFGAGAQDIYLVKTNANGDISWAKTYGGTADDAGESVVQTPDGGYFVVGFTLSFGFANGNPDDIYFKTDNLGNIIWAKTIGGPGYDLAFSTQQTSDGGFIIFGWTESYGAGQGDYYLVKTNAVGDTLWTRTYGGAGDEYGINVQQTTDHGYIMTGVTNGWGAGGFDMFNVKADSMGGLMWAKTYGGASGEGSSFVRQTSDSGFITIGSTGSFGSGSNDAFLIRSNGSGDTLWTRTYGNTGNDAGNCVRQHVSGDFLFTATYNGGATSQGLFSRTDPNGTILSSKFYGGANGEGNFNFNRTFDNGYILLGETTSFGAGMQDLYLIKTDSAGGSGCNESFTAPVLSTKPPTVVISPVPLVSSGGVIKFPNMQVHSNGIENKLCTMPLLPHAAFTTSDSTICVENGNCIDFFDNSTGNPTSWTWTFTGGLPDTSTQQNPSGICYYSPGTYSVKLTVSNINGSDSSIVSPMIIVGSSPSKPVVAVKGDTLSTGSASAYQWYYNGAPISGATDSFYIATMPGNYAVQITDVFGCSSLSDGVWSNVNELNADEEIRVYPNPAGEELWVMSNLARAGCVGRTTLEITNVLGQKVYNAQSATQNPQPKTMIALSGFAKGVYVVEVNNGNKVYRAKFVKE